VDTGDGPTYRGAVTTPGDRRQPDEGDRNGSSVPPSPYGPPYGEAAPYGNGGPHAGPPSELPYVYNPYGNLAYPTSYPTPPAGLGDEPPPRRPGSLHVALVLLVLAALPYLLSGLLAALSAEEVAGNLSAAERAQMDQLQLDPVALVRNGGRAVVVVALLFMVLAVLAHGGRRWARGLVAALTLGFALLVAAAVAATGGQGLAPGGALVVLVGPVLLAVVGVALMFAPAARPWFARPRR
jgi:hypothetical protein